MRKPRLPKDVSPSPRPWAWGLVPSRNGAIVKGADGSLVCVCHAADTQERCDKAVESMHTQLMHLANEGKTTVDIGRLSKYFAHLENILRGDARKAGK